MSSTKANQPSRFQSQLTTASLDLTSTSNFAWFESTLKQPLGPSNLAQLAAFGITPPKARKQASPETKAIAQVKSAQTREARGTMGKEQKLAITASAAVSKPTT